MKEQCSSAIILYRRLHNDSIFNCGIYVTYGVGFSEKIGCCIQVSHRSDTYTRTMQMYKYNSGLRTLIAGQTMDVCIIASCCIQTSMDKQLASVYI